jgi:small subunit ribosomal protein S9
MTVEKIKNNKGKNEGLEYYEGVGRRKTSVARVRIYPKRKEKQSFLVNDKDYQEYFPTLELREIVLAPFKKLNIHFPVTIKVKGGGIHSQAEAIRLGLSRALILFNPDFRPILRKAGYLTRDPRMRERKKFGLKRARRAPQWQKR